MTRAEPIQQREIDEILLRFRGVEGATLPVLHAIQGAVGFIPESAVPAIAAFLNRTRAEIHGVISFYHDFRYEPAGRHVVKLCRAEACQAMGGERLADIVKRDLALEFDETSGDGAVSLESVYCLGLCACAPAAMVDGRLVGRLDEEGAGALVREVRS
ncbi:formate dehydrogenase subunit gamma [Fodinicurvata sp. EGI_FJ10296]|uniref:formate dehydrogenase subunit gamma n=1 Tax=Fodinicurvata sp. EGI_FJ10296 TaxID=3231908 RepID=UPI0034549C13